MPEIDYAFLADYARVNQQGSLDVIGASWHFVRAISLPTSHRMAVAGRVRAQINEGPVPIEVSLVGPEDLYRMKLQAELASPGARGYQDGRVGHLFALEIEAPLLRVGLYEVLIELPGSGATRRLAFEVIQE